MLSKWPTAAHLFLLPARALPHALASYGLCALSSLAPADAAPAALDRRRPGPSKDLPSCGCVVHVVVRSNGMARRTQVSTVGKEPDPFVLRTAGDCYERPPARGCAPRVVAVGATQRGDAATHASRLLHNKSPLDSRAGPGGRRSSTSRTRSRRFGIARFASTRAQRRLRRGDDLVAPDLRPDPRRTQIFDLQRAARRQSTTGTDYELMQRIWGPEE